LLAANQTTGSDPGAQFYQSVRREKDKGRCKEDLLLHRKEMRLYKQGLDRNKTAKPCSKWNTTASKYDINSFVIDKTSLKRRV